MNGAELSHLGGILRLIEGMERAQQCPRIGRNRGRRLVDGGDGVGIAHVFDYTSER